MSKRVGSRESKNDQFSVELYAMLMMKEREQLVFLYETDIHFLFLTIHHRDPRIHINGREM